MLALCGTCDACTYERKEELAAADKARRSPTNLCNCCVYLSIMTDMHLPLDDTHVCVKCRQEVCGNCTMKEGGTKGQCFKCANPRKALSLRRNIETAGGREVCIARENTLMTTFREIQKKAVDKCKALRATQGITGF